MEKDTPFSWSDHDSVRIFLDMGVVTRGDGVWHFNNQLLSNENYCTNITSCIEAKKPHHIIVWYEDLKNKMKNIFVIHGKNMVKEDRKNKKIGQADWIWVQKAANYTNYDLSVRKKFELDLHHLEETELKGAIIRSKIILSLEKNLTSTSLVLKNIAKRITLSIVLKKRMVSSWNLMKISLKNALNFILIYTLMI